jgi:hypothetical protein
MIDAFRPSLTEIAVAEGYARRMRRARAVAAGNLGRAAALNDAAAWDTVIGWAQACYQLAGAWPGHLAGTLPRAREIARAAAERAERLAREAHAAGTIDPHDRTPRDLAALAAALDQLAAQHDAAPEALNICIAARTTIAPDPSLTDQ